ncbi:MAG: sulfite exporter TauE/SafE family protein [Bacteroidales bacterium]|nr:sulfite exporter TauE/SafE family protein [Bacteroidales bacterium]
MNIIEIIVLIVAGIAVGFINTLAGGATIISLSVLMFLGLPLNVANGTHRIAAAFQTMTSVSAFKREKVLDVKKGIAFGIPTIIGSIIGARIAIEINEAVFEKIVGVVMLLMIFLILYKPKYWLNPNVELMKKPVSILQIILFFILGLYGGFIYVGIGYFLLATIVLSAGYDLVKANAIKVLIVLMYVPFSLAVYIWGDMVNYEYGLILAVGQVVGAYIGAKTAVSKGAGFIRWIMIVFILFSVSQIFGFIDIQNWFLK